MDRDGKTTYSNIATVTVSNNKKGITVYPNPLKGKLVNIQFTNMEPANYTLVLYNSTGNKVLEKTLTHGGGSATYQLTVPTQIANGVYGIL